jgi:hypothetical protein
VDHLWVILRRVDRRRADHGTAVEWKICRRVDNVETFPPVEWKITRRVDNRKETMPYILHIERQQGRMKYRFKLQVPSSRRQEAIAQFNEVAARYPGASTLISCRRVDDDLDPDNPDEGDDRG